MGGKGLEHRSTVGEGPWQEVFMAGKVCSDLSLGSGVTVPPQLFVKLDR